MQQNCQLFNWQAQWVGSSRFMNHYLISSFNINADDFDCSQLRAFMNRINPHFTQSDAFSSSNDPLQQRGIGYSASLQKVLKLSGEKSWPKPGSKRVGNLSWMSSIRGNGSFGGHASSKRLSVSWRPRSVASWEESIGLSGNESPEFATSSPDVDQFETSCIRHAYVTWDEWVCVIWDLIRLILIVVDISSHESGTQLIIEQSRGGRIRWIE